MTVETATWPADLNVALPGVDDVVSEGDDHLRLIKTVLKNFVGTKGGQSLDTTLGDYLTTADAGSTYLTTATASATYATIAALNNYVLKAGDTMTGLLVLSGDPAVALGAATKQYVDNLMTAKAPLASPVFTGDPQAPTPSPGDNDTSIATTAFVTAAIAALGADAFSTQSLMVVDQKTKGTNGGTNTAGSPGGWWNKRTLNTVRWNDIAGASLASNEVTLPVGDFFVIACAPACGTSNGQTHKARFYNYTQTTAVVTGSSMANGLSAAADDATSYSWMVGQFSNASGSNAFGISHWIKNAETNIGLGAATDADDAAVEIYAWAVIWKIG